MSGRLRVSVSTPSEVSESSSASVDVDMRPMIAACDACAMTDATSASLSVTREGAVARIELDRPESMNALSVAAGAELRDALRAVGADPAVRAVLLTGAGRAFSTGADLKDPNPRLTDEGKLDLGYALREVFNPTIKALREMDKLVVAAVNGPAVGVACSIALACDYVIAARSSYMLMAFVNIGLVIDGGASVLLAARMGVTRATELALLGERLSAERAHELNLVNEVVDDEQLADAAASMAERFARGPQQAQASMKQLLNARYAGLEEALEHEAALQSRQGESAEFVEGVSAFLGKRPADFTGIA